MSAHRPCLFTFLACAAFGAWQAPVAVADATPVQAGKPAQAAKSAQAKKPTAVNGAIRASARREGLGVTAVQAAGPGALLVASQGALPRDAFLRRASLVAYAAFQNQPALHTIVFEHADGANRQLIRVAQQDLSAYLADQIPRAEYQRRVGYRAVSSPPKVSPAARPAKVTLAAKAPAPAAGALKPPAPATARPSAAAALRPPAPPALPLQVVPIPDLLEAVDPTRASRPIAPLPTLPAIAPPQPVAVPGPLAPPTASNDVTFAYSLGLGRQAYDAYTLEYDHPLLPTLSLRPALWIMSGFSPVNRLAGSGTMDGLSAALDMMGTTRRQVGPAQVSFEGGLGMRATSLLAAPGGWPGAHLRLGARWQALGLSMRYPLLTRGGDPTATWEATLGLAWTFGGATAP